MRHTGGCTSRRPAVTKLFDLSFSMTPPPPPRPALVAHEFNEFVIELPTHWRQLPTPQDNTFTYESPVDKATLVISADFYEISADKAQLIAEKNLETRLAANVERTGAPIDILSQGIQPHTSGAGLELHYMAAGADGQVVAYLGYVTSRKILNFTLVCRGDLAKAIALYERTSARFRPKLP